MTISACVVLLVGSVVLVVSPRKITGSLSAVAVHMSAERSGCVLNAVHCAACLSAWVVHMSADWRSGCVLNAVPSASCLSFAVVHMSADRRSGCTRQCVTGGVWEWYFQLELSTCQQTEGVGVHVSAWLVECGSDTFSLSCPHVSRLKEWLCSECCSLCVLPFICCGTHVSRPKEWLCTRQCVTGGVWEGYCQLELSTCQQTEGVGVHVSVWLVECGSGTFSLSCPHVSRPKEWLCSQCWQCSLCMFYFSGVHVSVWLVECGSDTVRDVSGPPSVLRQHAGRDSVQGMWVFFPLVVLFFQLLLRFISVIYVVFFPQFVCMCKEILPMFLLLFYIKIKKKSHTYFSQSCC